MKIAVNRVFSKIKSLTKRGPPSLFVINEKLITKEDYMRKLKDISRDTVKFSNVNGVMTGRVFLEVINNDVFIQHEIKHIFVVKPTFS